MMELETTPLGNDHNNCIRQKSRLGDKLAGKSLMRIKIFAYSQSHSLQTRERERLVIL